MTWLEPDALGRGEKIGAGALESVAEPDRFVDAFSDAKAGMFAGLRANGTKANPVPFSTRWARTGQEGLVKKVAVVMVAGLTLSGCWNFPTNNRVANGAIIGGVTGGVIGGVATGNLGGAAIGVGVGAATGALIGASVR